VTASRLAQIERAESAVRALGVGGDVRVRHLGTVARVELPPDVNVHWREPAARERLAAVVTEAGFAGVQLDLDGYRRGALQARTPARVIELTSGDTPRRERA
jgi:uncharacterized protein